MRDRIDVQLGPKRKGKPRAEYRGGGGTDRDSGRPTHIERLIDREGDYYSEIVLDAETGEVIRSKQESLSDHRGRGSAKTGDSK